MKKNFTATNTEPVIGVDGPSVVTRSPACNLGFSFTTLYSSPTISALVVLPNITVFAVWLDIRLVDLLLLAMFMFTATEGDASMKRLLVVDMVVGTMSPLVLGIL